MLPHLKDLFRQMDADGNDVLTRDEVESSPANIQQELADYMQAGNESLLELFDLLDVDESGQVDIEEFCDGIAKLVNSDAPVEVIRMLKQLKLLRNQQKEILQLLGPRAVHC